MPNRGELAIRVMHYDDGAPAEADAWLIVGMCAVGFLISTYLAVHCQPIADIPTLVAQYNLG
jgi:hypothetical protein